MKERMLEPGEAASAAAIQRALDELASSGGRLVLPELDLELDRSLRLHSGVELVGQGEKTVLRKGPGKVYPLSGYHNYGMADVPLLDAAGLQVGMTVSIHDNRTRGGFYETFATITWIEDNWVGLDHGIEADYSGTEQPCLSTVYPLVWGNYVRGAALRDMHIEGNRAGNAQEMGGCRGAAVYFCNSEGLEITGVTEQDYFGEGLGFQMCRDVVVRHCRFDQNTGNGLHPGAGSTNALLEDCVAEGNGRSGFFFCVRANHITVRRGAFRNNQLGVSIGTRDCYNLVEDCVVEGNRGAGVLVRQGPQPVEVHSCLIQRCQVEGNALQEGQAQVEVWGEAHDLIFAENRIGGGKAGVWISESARSIYLEKNHYHLCHPEVIAGPLGFAYQRPAFEHGYGTAGPAAFRHLERTSRFLH
ncbi:MAG: right-handed parallel beta-helix repeat-containing protein [Candidatus Handelsmanbacteria bacterium]|nr:right-handed parallel beta-helix repeat-containing protein [Candidatus Handelsmanbacteria bacterium]